MNRSDGYTPTQPQDSNQATSPTLAERGNELPQLGDLLLNKYKITAKKEGGFGIVFFVTDISTNQKYAVKTYKSECSNEEQFKSEVGFWIDLDVHPNIVSTYFVEVVNKRPFLFMEYISGNVLRDLIGKLTVHQAVSFAYQICLAMEFINRRERKVIHADLKPENILITSGGIAKVLDFGLAKSFYFQEAIFSRELAGSIPYMSPEQLRGKVLDEKSDIFSFGIMFYEMLTGKLPYPFDIENLDNSLKWREQLEKLYDDFKFYTMGDDYRLNLWREIQDEGINEQLKRLVIACIFPYPHYRWKNFNELCRYFEFLIPEKITYVANSSEVDNLHLRALSLYKIGQSNKALTVFNQALQENPHKAEIWRDAAIVLVDVGMLPTAIEFIACAKKLDPNININDPKIASLDSGGLK